MRRYCSSALTLVIMLLCSSVAFAADTWTVDAAQFDDSACVSPTFLCKTMGAAVAGALGGDTINVLAGSYTETLIINKQLTLNGAQAGVDACDRAASESVVTSAGVQITLQGGSAGTVIDGFSFSGGTNQIASSSGPIDNLQLLNNRHDGATSSSVFLNDSGVDITVNQISVDGSTLGSGGAFHLDQDNFDGFQLTNSCFYNSTNGFGFFVDGNRNVGVSGARAPLFDGNLFDGGSQLMNVGKRALDGATISNNTFINAEYDGLIGGPKDTLINKNVFKDNGRRGLRLTAFSDANALKGPINCTVTENCFASNGLVMTGGAGITFGPLSPNMATNTVNNNNFRANSVGALNFNAATVDMTNNFWGAADGPSGPDGAGSGDGVDGTGGGGSLTFSPWLGAADPGAPDCLPAPLPASDLMGLLALLGLLSVFVALRTIRRI